MRCLLPDTDAGAAAQLMTSAVAADLWRVLLWNSTALLLHVMSRCADALGGEQALRLCRSRSSPRCMRYGTGPAVLPYTERRP